MNLSNQSFQFLVLQPLLLIKQLEFILSEKMNSQSAVNYATGIMNDFFHSYLEGMNRIRWALARESPQTYGKS